METTKPSLIGLAFTSPQIVVLLSDREKFRVHLYQRRPNELHAFTEAEDDRLPVVLLTSVRDLYRVHEIEGVHAFVLFDDPEVLHQIEGCRVLDCSGDSTVGYSPQTMTAAEFNSLLAESAPFNVNPQAHLVLKELAQEIQFRKLLNSYGFSDDFKVLACLHLIGAITQKSWVSRGQKVALTDGVPANKIAEIENFVNGCGEGLWRAWYEVNEEGVPPEAAAAQMDANLEDLQYIISVIGKRTGIRYSRNPRKVPVTLKKKRKTRKKTPAAKATLENKKKGGQTIATSPISKPVKASPSTQDTGVDEKAQGESQEKAESMEDNQFPLVSILKRLDEATKDSQEAPYHFSRTVCAYVCGIISTRRYTPVYKAAVEAGASQEDLDSIRAFMKNDSYAQSLKSAYQKAVYLVGVSVEEAAKAEDVFLPTLQALMAYKPLAYIHLSDPGSSGA